MTDPRTQGQPDEAMVDLLIKQVTEGLSPDEQRALDVLDSALLSSHLRDFERAVAAITLAAGKPAGELPPALALRLAEQGRQHFGKVVDLGAARADGDRGTSERGVGERGTGERGVGERGTGGRTAAERSGSGTYGWLAAAACLVLAIFGWVRTPAPPAPVAVLPPVVVAPPIEKPVVAPTPAEERAALLANAGSLKVTLGATKDPAAAGVTGDVVWDPVTQRGFLHFAGLAANDPAVHQYQVWIFDAARDQRYPVDGGVFDVPANAGDIVIPIRATLMVHKPAAFAVTVEKPGGAVVSGREHVVALGAAG